MHPSKLPRLELTIGEDMFNCMIKTYLDYVTSGGKGCSPRFGMTVGGYFLWLRVGEKREANPIL